MLCPIRLTQQLVELNTINPGSNEHEAARILGGLLEDAGFSVDFYEFDSGRTSLIASLKGGESARPICFTGHLDTVPLGKTEWSIPPFSGEISDEKLFGRGATDMKAGIAAFVCAAINFAKYSGHSKGVTLVITAGEETGCAGARYLKQLDGVLGEADAIVVGEPTSNYPLIGHKGALWLDLSIGGVTGHGSMPHTGVNAIYRANDVVSTLKEFDFNHWSDELFGKPTLNVGTIHGGMNLNSIPDLVHVGIDIRTIPGMSHDNIRTEISNKLDPSLDHLETIIDLEPVSTNPESTWAMEVFEICSKYINSRPDPRIANYFTDASILQTAYGGVPTVVLGPGEPELAHQTNEYCYVSKIEQATEIYKEIINHWEAR